MQGPPSLTFTQSFQPLPQKPPPSRSKSREIKHGQLTGRVFSPIVLTGYVPDLLKSISMVSGNFELEGEGFCGKGWKEWVKVSSGGPCIKARIRLG